MAESAPAARSPRLLMLAAVVVIVAALYFAKQVLVPIAIGVMLSFLLGPIVIRIQRLGLGRVPAVLFVVGIVIAAIIMLGWAIYGQVIDLATKLPQYQQNIEEKVTWVKRFTSSNPIERATTVIENTIKKATTQNSQPATQPAAANPHNSDAPVANSSDSSTVPTHSANRPPSPLSAGSSATPQEPIPVTITNSADGPSHPFIAFLQTLSPLIDPLASLFIIAIFVIFMLISREDLRDRIIRLIGQGQIHVTTQAMDEAAHRISRYLVAQCCINGSYGLIIALGLWLIGLTFGHAHPLFPNALLWGLLTGILRFIPYIGPWLGAAPCMLLALAVYPGMAVPLAVLILFILVEIVTSNVLEPWLYGASAGASMIAILAAAIFWTWLWGIPGLLLSTPLTVLIVVMGKYVPQLAFFNILLGDEPPLEPHFRLYQRLLAQDVDESEDLLAEFAAERPLVQVYDQVVLPALGLAESDWHRGELDDARQQSIRRQIRDIVEDLPDLPFEAQPTGASTSARSKDSKEGQSTRLSDAVEATEEKSSPPEREAIAYERRILCLPARDEADEIAGMLLAQILTRKGYSAEFTSVESLASEYIETVNRHGAQVVFISALPPAAVPHARYLLKRLRAKLKDLKIIVGLWTVCGDLRRPRQRLESAGADRVVCTLEEAVDTLRQVVEPLLLRVKT